MIVVVADVDVVVVVADDGVIDVVDGTADAARRAMVKGSYPATC